MDDTLRKAYAEGSTRACKEYRCKANTFPAILNGLWDAVRAAGADPGKLNIHGVAQWVEWNVVLKEVNSLDDLEEALQKYVSTQLEVARGKLDKALELLRGKAWLPLVERASHYRKAATIDPTWLLRQSAIAIIFGMREEAISFRKTAADFKHKCLETAQSLENLHAENEAEKLRALIDAWVPYKPATKLPPPRTMGCAAKSPQEERWRCQGERVPDFHKFWTNGIIADISEPPYKEWRKYGSRIGAYESDKSFLSMVPADATCHAEPVLIGEINGMQLVLFYAGDTLRLYAKRFVDYFTAKYPGCTLTVKSKWEGVAVVRHQGRAVGLIAPAVAPIQPAVRDGLLDRARRAVRKAA